jgi:hypothetical protein
MGLFRGDKPFPCTSIKSGCRKDKRGFDLICEALPFGRLWYGEPNRDQRCNRLRKVLQPVTQHCDQRLR